MWGVRSLQQPAPHVQENLRHWGCKGHRVGDKPDRCASRGKEMRITQTQSVEVLHSNPQVVPVQTRWFIGPVHQIYLALNYLIIGGTLFCLQCSIYRYKFTYSYSCTCTTQHLPCYVPSDKPCRPPYGRANRPSYHLHTNIRVNSKT